MMTKILITIASVLVVFIVLLALFINFKGIQENKGISLKISDTISDMNANCWAE